MYAAGQETVTVGPRGYERAAGLDGKTMGNTATAGNPAGKPTRVASDNTASIAARAVSDHTTRTVSDHTTRASPQAVSTDARHTPARSPAP